MHLTTVSQSTKVLSKCCPALSETVAQTKIFSRCSSGELYGSYQFQSNPVLCESVPKAKILFTYSSTLCVGFTIFSRSARTDPLTCYNVVFERSGTKNKGRRNNFFVCTAVLRNQLPSCCFPPQYNVNSFKMRMDRHLIELPGWSMIFFQRGLPLEAPWNLYDTSCALDESRSK